MGSSLIVPSPLKVVIDARMVSDTPHGIARYVTQIAQSLKGIHDKSSLPYQPVFLVNAAERESLFQPFQTYITRSKFLSIQELFEIPSILKILKADLYHSPSFSSLWNCPCPSIVTIHDLNHLTYGSMSKKIYYSVLLRKFARSSRVITTVSEFSQKEIANWLGIPPSKIQILANVIEKPQPPHPEKAQKRVQQFGLQPGKYFFSISNSKPHKNLETLVAAHQRYSTQTQDPWPLVLIGAQNASNSQVIGLGHRSDEDVQALLTQSAAMMFPSRYEGFGLPPLEAVVAQVRLAVSRIPPHEEALQDLAPYEALWVNPMDIHGWTGAFHKIQRGELAQPRPETAEKIVSRFSQERMGQHIDQIYQRVLKG